MQLPTLTNTRLRSTADAHLVIHAARLGLLRMVERRLDSQERAEIQVGNIYVWEERGALDLSGMGIERWTDGIRWGPSRLRNDFLFYQQRDDLPKEKQANGPSGKRRDTELHDSPSVSTSVDEINRLIKQTYSVHVYDGQQAPNRRIKLHITAYFNRRMVESLNTVDSNPALRSLVVPPGMYRSARIGKPRSGETIREEDIYSTSRRPTITLETDGYDKLPPIHVPGLDSPTFSDDYLEIAQRRPDSMVHSPGPMFSRGRALSTHSQEGPSEWIHGRQGIVGGTDMGQRNVALPPLKIALGVPWSPTQRYAEDDMQLARLDVARALV